MVKRFFMALALATAACTHVPVSAPGTVTDATGMVAIEGTRALIIANHAYQSAAGTALTLIRLGAIKGAAAEQVRALNQRCLQALRVAAATQDQAVRVAQATELLGLVVELHTAIQTGEAK